MNLLENFDKLNNKLTNLLEENKKLKQQYNDLQEEKLKEREYFSKENQKLKDKLEEIEKQFQQNVSNLAKENKELKQHLSRENQINQVLKEKLEECEKQLQQNVLNLARENKELIKQQNNQELKEEREKQFRQHILNLVEENKKIKQRYNNLSKENQELKVNLKESEQLVQDLEKHKNEQLERISQNIVKTLKKLELDEVNENDINKSLADKLTTFPLIDDDNENVQEYKIGNSSEGLQNSFSKGLEEDADKVDLYNPINENENSSKRLQDYFYEDLEKDTDKSRFYTQINRNENSSKRSYKSFRDGNIRAVVGLDFGTTFSGFSYCHVSDEQNINTNDQWLGEIVQLKTNTVLEYDENLDDVISWGYRALTSRPSRRRESKRRNVVLESKRRNIVELFKLHLGNLQPERRAKLSVNYKKAITDYLHEIGKLIKKTIETTWSGIDFLRNTLFVLTVPAEYTERAKAIMRDCVYNAGLIENKHSRNLQFTTEPEAAAIYCMDNLKEHLAAKEITFMVVDCGGGTVDLRKQLSEITESAGDYCGSSFIDNEFIKYLQGKLGEDAMNILRVNHYEQLQYMVQEFCRGAKFLFTGDDPDFLYEMDLEEVCPTLLQYVKGNVKEALEEAEWLIRIDFKSLKSMFDPVVERILRMIHTQLDNSREKCSLMFLVGGFSQSKYLQKRIKQEFQDIVDNISVPRNPISAISRGAVIYGLSNSLRGDTVECGYDTMECIISSRVLKYTYGIRVRNCWVKGNPEERKLQDGGIDKFCCLVKRGTTIRIDEKIIKTFTPLNPIQTKVSFRIYYTRKSDAEYCDEPGMEYLGKLTVDLPGSSYDQLDKILFSFTFGQMEIIVTAMNETNGQNYSTIFELDTQ